MGSIWQETVGDGPLVAVAVHDGHDVREEVARRFAVTESHRLREEDPHTGAWATVCPTRIVGVRSRFEVDLNRSPERAVYLRPEDAWGIEVWRGELPAEIAARSRDAHADFYDNLRRILSAIEARHGRFVVYDLHTYNHRRGGPEAPLDCPHANPQVNVGTGTMDRTRWGTIVDRFLADLGVFEFPGGPLDVRENVRFRGGYLPGWVHENFPESGCAVAIEVRKFFMDEWTGELDVDAHAAIGRALAATTAGVLEELERL